MTRIWLILIFTALTAHPGLAHGAGPQSRFQMFAAAGSALGVGSLRFGYNSWEGGLLNQHTLGFARQLFFRETVYGAIGFGVGIAQKPGLAAYGGLGWEPRLFWKVHFRTEMNAAAATNGQTTGELLLGASLRF